MECAAGEVHLDTTTGIEVFDEGIEAFENVFVLSNEANVFLWLEEGGELHALGFEFVVGVVLEEVGGVAGEGDVVF